MSPRRALALCTVLAACDRPAATPPQRVPEVAQPLTTSTPTTVFAGGRRSCTLRDGGVRCWGDANHGTLGPGVVMSMSSVPTEVPGLVGATAVALGESHACALLPDATVRCWGSNEYGALGNPDITGDSPTPVAVPGLTGVTQLAAAANRTCALAGGTVSCWGDSQAKSPVPVPGLADIRQITLGDRHACARSDRDVLCWGSNDHGQLGRPGPATDVAPVPGLGPVDELAAAGDTTCARKGGTVHCWGLNDDAQLGEPDRKDSPTPRQVPGLTDAAALALGPRHACALRTDATVTCWGGSDRGEFGFPRGCPEDRTGHSAHAGPSGVIMVYCAAPTPVAGLTDIVALAHGHGHACALDRAGALRCWGGSGYGELGNRDHGAGRSQTPVDVTFPAPRPTSAGTRAVEIGANGEWSCAALADRTVRCWGAGSLGQLGPDITTSSATPVEIPGLTDVAELALGGYHACARTRTNSVKCWGYNGSANLGDGTVEARREPVTPNGLPEVTALSASGDSVGAHTCALAKDATVWCWGANQSGQIVPGGPQNTPPIQLPGLTNITQVVAGLGATCVLEQGVPRCWGVLATAKGRTLVTTPTVVAGIDRLVEIGLGYQVACGRRDDDSVWCWGQRQDTDLAPTKLELGGQIRSLAVGSYGAAALRADGKLLTWGIENTKSPITETSLPGLTRITSSGSHTCALDDQGRVHCIGWNMNGQLGDPDMGAGGESKVPTTVPL